MLGTSITTKQQLFIVFADSSSSFFQTFLPLLEDTEKIETINRRNADKR